MKRTLAGIILIVSVLVVVPVQAAENVSQTLQSAGVEITTEPSQASAEALLKLPSVYTMPGTFTYWIKQIVEQIQLIFTADPADRTDLLMAFSRDRLAEGYQAIKSGQAEQALAALQRYQQQQFDLATNLNSLQDTDVDIAPYLNRLQDQLGIQQALQDFVNQEVNDKANREKISQLLEVSSVQRLAWQRYNQSALLGARDVHPNLEASPSATPSATPAGVESRE